MLVAVRFSAKGTGWARSSVIYKISLEVMPIRNMSKGKVYVRSDTQAFEPFFVPLIGCNGNHLRICTLKSSRIGMTRDYV